MSKLITNNLSRLNKLSSKDGVISGDKASGRIEIECLSNPNGFEYIVIPLSIEVEDGGFFVLHLKSNIGGLDEKITYYTSVDKIVTKDTYAGLSSIIITGSKIKGIYNKIASVDFGDDYQPYFNLNEEPVVLKSFQFPKDSPDSIDCENIFANWNLQGELPELDDRISNLSGAFANTQITGEIPKLPKNLQSASNAFLNCTGLTGPSKDLIQQFITVNKPYFDLNYENMVSGCEKCVTSWFSTNCGGDHDIIEYLRYTSSKNSATTFPYIMITLPRGLKDKHYVRTVFKNRERFSSFTNCLYCSRDTMGKCATLFLQLNGANYRHRVDTNSGQFYITDNGKQDLRPSDFSIFTRSLTEAKMTKFFSTEVEEYKTSITTSNYQTSTKSMTLFASQVAGVNVSNQGKLAIAELDIWDDEGYLIRMRSQGENMVDLVSGTVYSSNSSTPFTTENVEMRDVDKEDLLSWEKFTGKTLTPEFWTEYDIALQDYKANPTKTEKWTVSFDKESVTFSSNCPYFDAAPTKPLVNFFLTQCSGVYPGYYNGYPGPHQVPKSPFHADTNQLMYFPNVTSCYQMVGELKSLENLPIIPKGNTAPSWKTRVVQKVYFPNITTTNGIFSSGYALESYLYAPKVNTITSTYTYGSGSQAYLKKIDFTVGKVTACTNFNINYSPVNLIILRGDFSECTDINKFIIAVSSSAKTTPIKIQFGDVFERCLSFPSVTNAQEFAKDRGGFDQALIVPSLTTGTNAFLNSGLSAYNIQLTLESLPEHTDGNVHTITFTGCPGIVYNETNETFEGMANCPVFLKDNVRQELRKAFVSAINKGWTVEIGTAQNTASAVMTLDLDSEPQVIKYYKITESEDGDFEDSLGKKYILQEGSAFSKEGVNIGYFPFTSKEECLLSCGLTEIVEDFPVLEEVEESQNS